MKTWQGITIAAAAVIISTSAAWAWLQQRGTPATTAFKTATIVRGDLLVTIDATGTLEPEEVVDVGAQVAGQILAFGTDAAGQPLDYGSQVEQGMVIARIDEALSKADVEEAEAQVNSAQAGVRMAEARAAALVAKVAQAEAQVTSAQAGVGRAEADALQLLAKLAQAERDWARAEKLGPSEALAQTTYDGYRSAYDIAKANTAVGEAEIQQAKAALTSARAAFTVAQSDVTEGEASLAQAKASQAQAETGLWRAKRNLGYCTITSPVKGVIIDRRVNIGQTVVSSMEAPSLFLIARDLRRMQVWVAVNEADVAKIHPGQSVTFTIDALPGETFRGEVVKVRLNASMTQNVVTYTVEIVTDNADGRLLPYLTANARFEVQRRDAVLQVSTAALRWTPTLEQVAPEYREAAPAVAGRAPAAGTAADEVRWGVVYAQVGQYVKPIPVQLGLSTGASTEISGEGLAEGLAVVTGVEQVAARAKEASNPFTPKLPAPPKGGMPPR